MQQQVAMRTAQGDAQKAVIVHAKAIAKVGVREVVKATVLGLVLYVNTK